MAKTAGKRVNMLWSGNELDNLHECMGLLRLNDEAGAIRYLVGRGMEALSVPLAQRRMISKMETEYSPQQLLPLLGEAGIKPDERPK
jgi:hypothetical protein